MYKNIDTVKFILKVICLLGILILLYLFALNGRYMRIGDVGIYDKWKNEMYRVGSEEIPSVINNKRHP